MSRFKITTTKTGKCDVTLTIYNRDNKVISNYNSTYYIKPTIKELLDHAKTYKKHGAQTVKISTSPSWSNKTYSL